jgi:hypothetical protein
MTTSHGGALSIRAGALLGAVAVLVAGCAAAHSGIGPRVGRAGDAQGAIAARTSGRILPYRPGGTAGPGSASHGSGSRPARAPALCVSPVGGPVVYRTGDASGSLGAVPMCLCCSSFTVYLSKAPTASAKVAWFVVN